MAIGVLSAAVLWVMFWIGDRLVARLVPRLLAALTGGAFWAALFAWRGTLVAPILSHLLWDLAIIVWFPTRRRAAERG